MSYSDFNTWMKTEKNHLEGLNVKIMDQNIVIAEVKKAKVIVGYNRNGSGYPDCFTIISGNTVIKIGDRYINQIIKSGEYWCVFVDGHEHYLIS